MPNLPEPQVTIEYHLEYQLPNMRDDWASHARATGEEAGRKALKEFRDITPDWRWRAVKYESITQILDW